MDPPFDASIITDLLLHVIGANLAILYAILLAFHLHGKELNKVNTFNTLKNIFPLKLFTKINFQINI